jgi:hypothetical protein
MPLINLPLLSSLVAELDALADRPDVAGRREDLHYTLCVCTGLREPARALEHARGLLAAAHTPTSRATATSPHSPTAAAAAARRANRSRSRSHLSAGLST